MGTITMTMDWSTSHRMKWMLQETINKKWNESIFMADQGYGKHYWAEQIDWAADMLLQIIKQERP